MLPRTLWLWFSVGWFIPWTYVSSATSTSVCSLGPCGCNQGKLKCDCSTSNVTKLTLKNAAFDSYSFSTISVTNCKHVHVGSRALTGLPALQKVTVANVTRLTLDEQAFSWTDTHQHSMYSTNGYGIIVNISDTFIPNIPSYCFQGHQKEILLINVNITLLSTYAFSSINNADKLEFIRVNFDKVETQSFKKSRVSFIAFIDTYAPFFPERTIWDFQVEQEVRFVRATVDKIESKSVNVHGCRNFRITESLIGHVEGGAFNAVMKGDVSIHDNTFYRIDRDAFVGFTVEARYVQEAGKQDFIFENNTLAEFESAALTFNTSGFSPRLDWIVLSKQCSCDKIEEWETDLVFFVPDSSDPFKRTTAPLINTAIYCYNPMPKRLEEFTKFNCVIKSSLLLTIIAILGILLVILTIAAVLFCRYRGKGKRYINVPVSRTPLKPAADGNRGHMLIVPDGKTYRETELHVIVEHAEAIVSTEYVSERSEGQ